MNPLTHILKNLPSTPGIYRFIDVHGKILYIGKAKNLKNRIRSYFNFEKTGITPHKDLSYQKRIMVSRATDIKYTVVSHEDEALLLENTLIKKHQPLFNIDLKDDKTYVYIKISKHTPFPRIEVTRHADDRQADYFGPYTSAGSIRETLKLIRTIFPYRTCTRDLSKIPNGKICLLYHIGLCHGPCEGKQTIEEYNDTIEAIKKILRGNYEYLLEQIALKMHEQAQSEHFEKAKYYRDQMRAIQDLLKQQIVISSRKENFNVHSIVAQDGLVSFNTLIVRDGRVLDSQNIIKDERVNLECTELLRQFLFNYYQSAREVPKEIIISDQIDIATAHALHSSISMIGSPRKGYKKEVLEMSLRNAKEALIRQRLLTNEREIISKNGPEELRRVLKLTHPLKRIECFDISNNQGTSSYGSMVVFHDGAPRNDQYRLFKIESVTTPDDFASMYETLSRRLKKIIDHDVDFAHPDLIVIDGGKGQLNAALAAARNLGIDTIPFISLAKQEEEIFIPGRSTSIKLPPHSSALLLLQQIRDEAHRFGITTYRKTHRKTLLASPLDEIPGIGPKTKKILLQFYGSLEKIHKADISEIARLIGQKKAEEVKKYTKKAFK